MRMRGVIHLWLVCFSVFMYPLTTFMKKKTKPCGVYVKALIPCPISRESDSSGPGRDLGVCILISFLGESGQQALHLALASAGSRPRPGGSRPLTAALCCGFCSPRLRAEFRGDLLMRQEVGLSLEAG